MSPSGLLAHRLAGAGEVVLLLNGGMMSYAAWEEIARALEGAHRVLRCDFRGQLLSPGPVPRALSGQVEEVVGLLDALGIARVHAVGASFGAQVGLLLAALHPERVASLTAITATDRFTPGMREDAGRLRAACREALGGGDRGRIFDAMVPTTFGPAYAAANASALAERRKQIGSLPDAWFAGLDGLLASLEDLDLRPHLARVECPTLVVAAELDQVFPLEHARALAAAVRGAMLVVVEGSGHALVVEKPRELLVVIQSFLARVASARPGPMRGEEPREGGRP